MADRDQEIEDALGVLTSTQTTVGSVADGLVLVKQHIETALAQPEDPPPPPPPPPPPADDLEPVISAHLQIAVSVGSQPQQSWDGFGWGAGGVNGVPTAKIQAHAAQLFDELDTRVIRLHNPREPNFVSAYKPLVDFALSRGVDRILATGYSYVAGDPAQAGRNLASDVLRAVDAGIPISHVSMHNEPGAGKQPAWPDAYQVPAHRALRDELDARGLQAVKIIALEYANFHTEPEHHFDRLDAAGLIPGVVALGAGHSYRSCSTPMLYDQRYARRGVGLWQAEAGNSANPQHGARLLCDLNMGVEAWISHIGQSANSSDGDLSQKLVDWNGNRLPWHTQCRLISQALPRGTVLRRATCDRRPGGGLPDYDAVNMLRRPGSHPFPELNAACGRRPDGQWFLAIQNTTYGTTDANKYLGAHFGARTIQVTAAIAELLGRNGEFVGHRGDGNGDFVEVAYPMVDGRLRVTLPERGLLTLVGG